MSKQNVSNVGDLSSLAKEIEAVFKHRFGVRPAICIAFALPSDSHAVHWVTNVSRADGVKMFKETAEKMLRQTN